MRPIKYATFAALLVLLAILAGCTGKISGYYFDFQQEKDLSNDEGSWHLVLGFEPPAFTEDGVYLNGQRILAPHKYAGDFDVYLNFYIDIQASEIIDASFILGDNSSGFYENALAVQFGIRPDGSGHYSVFEYADHEAYKYLSNNTTITGIRDQRINTLKLSRIGNNVSVYMNGTNWGSFTIGHYTQEFFFPFIDVSIVPKDATPTYKEMVIRSINIDYHGLMSLIVL